VREGVGDSGTNSQAFVHFRTLSDLTDLFAQSEYVNIPVHNFVDDITWTKGKHTLQFGTNLRLVHNNRAGNIQNVSYAVADPFSLDTNAGIANDGGSLDPSSAPNGDYPLVDQNFGELYDFSAVGLAGLVTVSNVLVNQDKHGDVFPSGELIPRHFKAWEAEWYAQDAWRVTPNFVITAGLRYSLLQPPYEVGGNQAALRLRNAELGAVGGASGLGGNQIPVSGPLGSGPSTFIPGGLGDALHQMFAFQAPYYGFAINMTIPVRSSSAQANLADALVSRARDQYSQRQLEQQIILQVKFSTNQLNMSLAQIDASKTARDLAQKNVEAEQQKYELGGVTAFEVLDAQSRLASVEGSLLQAYVDYRKAVVAYERAVWTLLDGMGIIVETPKVK